jgi:hypothetical protein
MASCHENRISGICDEVAVEPTPPGPVCRWSNRLAMAAAYGFLFFAAISSAVGTRNFWLGGAIS